ncbi:MAG: SIMPL domain-containing protein [Caulobacter sp.]|nr:SIMPL domain-containing protein [Caulobacter sp.]
MTAMISRTAPIALAGVLLAAAAALPAFAQSAPDAAFRATTLNLSATGETKIAPDMATITLGVQNDAPTAAAALSANAAQMNKVVAALKKAGVAERDIQTSNLNVNPQYVYEQNQPPKLNGYQASNQVTIQVRDLAKLGQTVDATVNAGATNVGGISFGLQNPQAAEDAARLDAVRALQTKADLYAKATGYKIVRLVNIGEGGGYTPAPPVPMFAMAKRMEADSSPVSGGELKVRIDVSATYELAK